MRVVVRMTGLTADAVRAWERRYGAVTPSRTDGKARRYSAAEVARLALLKRVTDAGHSIGSIAALTERDLAALLDEATPTSLRDGETRLPDFLEAYLSHVERYDVRAAEELFDRAAAHLDARAFALDVVAPLLREVGVRWSHNALSIAHEHYVSAQCRALLGARLAALPVLAGAPRILLAAPEGHLHELGLLIGGILAASRGARPIHLGPDVPWSDLKRAALEARPEIVLLAFARDLSLEEASAATRRITQLGKSVEVWIGAPKASRIENLKGARIFESFEALDMALAHRFGGG